MDLAACVRGADYIQESVIEVRRISRYLAYDFARALILVFSFTHIQKKKTKRVLTANTR